MIITVTVHCLVFFFQKSPTEKIKNYFFSKIQIFSIFFMISKSPARKKKLRFLFFRAPQKKMLFFDFFGWGSWFFFHGTVDRDFFIFYFLSHRIRFFYFFMEGMRFRNTVLTTLCQHWWVDLTRVQECE